MPGWGMRVIRAGQVEMDNLTNMGRIILRVPTGGVNGSVTHDGLLTGFVEWQVVIVGVPLGGGITGPSVSVSGNTLSWVHAGGVQPNCIIIVWVR